MTHPIKLMLLSIGIGWIMCLEIWFQEQKYTILLFYIFHSVSRCNLRKEHHQSRICKIPHIDLPNYF